MTPDTDSIPRQAIRVLVIYAAVGITGVMAVCGVLVGPSASLPEVASTAIALSGPSLVAAAAAAIVMLRLNSPAPIIAIGSALTAGAVGLIVIVGLGLNRARPDPDAFFDPTGLIVIGSVALLATMGLVAGSVTARIASRT